MFFFVHIFFFFIQLTPFLLFTGFNYNEVITTTMMATTITTTTASTTATLSSCLWGGNRCNFKMARARQQRRNDEMPGRRGGHNKEAMQTEKGPRDVV
jgi:hypothetical protein